MGISAAALSPMYASAALDNQIAPYTPGSGTTTGQLDWGLPGSGLGVPADPSGASQRAAGYIPWDPNTNGPVATDKNSPLYLSGRLPLSNGLFIDGRTVEAVVHPSAQVVSFGEENAGESLAGKNLLGGTPAIGIAAAAGYGPQPTTPEAKFVPPAPADVKPSIPLATPQMLNANRPNVDPATARYLVDGQYQDGNGNPVGLPGNPSGNTNIPSGNTVPQTLPGMSVVATNYKQYLPYIAIAVALLLLFLASKKKSA